MTYLLNSGRIRTPEKGHDVSNRFDDSLISSFHFCVVTLLLFYPSGSADSFLFVFLSTMFLLVTALF